MLQLLKPMCLKPVLYNKRSHCNEKSCTATKSGPCSLQLEKVCTRQPRPSAAIKKKKKKKEQEQSSRMGKQAILGEGNRDRSKGELLPALLFLSLPWLGLCWLGWQCPPCSHPFKKLFP